MKWFRQHKDPSIHNDIAVRFVKKISLLCPFEVAVDGNILRISELLTCTLVLLFTVVSKNNVALEVLCSTIKRR